MDAEDIELDRRKTQEEVCEGEKKRVLSNPRMKRSYH